MPVIKQKFAEEIETSELKREMMAFRKPVEWRRNGTISRKPTEEEGKLK